MITSAQARAGWLLAIALTSGVAGCAGGQWHIIDLNFRRLPEGAKLIEPVEADECDWWIDSDTICIAMQRERAGLLTKLNQEHTSLSLVLPGLPAAKARDYQLDRNSMRAYLRRGTRHERFASTRGICSIRYEPSGGLTGRFRLTAKRQIFSILTGWSGAGAVVITGEFRAGSNANKGKAILQTTEEDGMNRSGSQNVNGRTYGVPRQVTGPPVGRSTVDNSEQDDK